MKLKKHQKLFKWKHIMGMNVFCKPYMSSRSQLHVYRRAGRCNIQHIRKTIAILTSNDASEFPWPNKGDRAGTITKGIHLNYGNMTFSILTQGGVTK